MSTWSDLDAEKSTHTQMRFNVSNVGDRQFVLRVVEGPDAGAELAIDGTQPAAILVGQSPACGLRLSDRTASRRHLSLDLEDSRLRIEDQGSRNGTFVNGVCIREAYLVGGERIQLGETTIQVEVESAQVETELPDSTGFGRVVGLSAEMRRLYPLCERLAVSNIPVVIEGETGTGKELLAEALHERGPRANGPFVVFDCTTVAPNLVESELFGHKRGAFTGATERRQGLFELANGGTLLIDEIGDLDISLQAKLLRAIERQELRPVGDNTVHRVDVRVLAATRRDLDREVQQGRFRDDLFHRLAVGRIELPPLRRRKGDVPVLARYFAEQIGADFSAIPPEVLVRWEEHNWPGNVRELHNAVSRYLALGDFEPGRSRPEATRSGEDPFGELLEQNLPYTRARDEVVAEFTKHYVRRALDREGGNVTKAAAASGVGRRYFQMLRAKADPLE